MSVSKRAARAGAAAFALGVVVAGTPAAGIAAAAPGEDDSPSVSAPGPAVGTAPDSASAPQADSPPGGTSRLRGAENRRDQAGSAPSVSNSASPVTRPRPAAGRSASSRVASAASRTPGGLPAALAAFGSVPNPAVPNPAVPNPAVTAAAGPSAAKPVRAARAARAGPGRCPPGHALETRSLKCQIEFLELLEHPPRSHLSIQR